MITLVIQFHQNFLKFESKESKLILNSKTHKWKSVHKEGNWIVRHLIAENLQ